MLHVTVAERSRQAYCTLLEWAGVGSIPANSDAQNVPSFRRWRFEMKLSPSALLYSSRKYIGHELTCVIPDLKMQRSLIFTCAPMAQDSSIINSDESIPGIPSRNRYLL